MAYDKFEGVSLKVCLCDQLEMLNVFFFENRY
jgi:hypothetical protein